jgi:cytochrome P450
MGYTRAVIQESMRLYPPAWIIGREAQSEFQLGDFRIAHGSQILTSQWVVHRNGRWFEEPEDFLPGRWLNGLQGRCRDSRTFRLAAARAFALEITSR